ncbi:hypothetical protein ACFWBG_33750 [Nocardia salmonicida]|uniref:hypothetical protein n=1 Tax=Nocardia salmonicida TaxID=53431 RepID=UPI00366AC95B
MTESSSKADDLRFTVKPGAIELFCFSAATWNPHRIHYDTDYARNIEGHPDVIVPGPMQGAWLLELADGWAESQNLEVSDIEYRNILPAFANRELTVGARPTMTDNGVRLEVWVDDSEHRLCIGTVNLRKKQGFHP